MPSTPSVLGNLTLGYEPLWNRARQVAGYRLWVDAPQASAIDAAHLLQALGNNYPQARRCPLLLQVRNAPLLLSLLDHAPEPGIWLRIDPALLDDARLAGHVRAAQARGHTLVSHEYPGVRTAGAYAPLFAHVLRALSPHESLTALRAARQRPDNAPATRPTNHHGPWERGLLYEGLAHPLLVDEALDHRQALAVIGWPTDEVLHRYRYRQIQPSHALVQALDQALSADAALEHVEALLGQEPLLTYRFLRWANSAALGLARPVDSVRAGLLVVGLGQLQSWLQAQRPATSHDLALQPVRTAMVLRARIMEQLCEAGIEDELRREVFLCGLFSQMDQLLGEPLGAAMWRLPLSGRLESAILGQTGPYAAWLEVASSLESSHAGMVREVCRAHGIALESANRALLRALASTTP